MTSTYGELGTILIGLPGLLECKKMNALRFIKKVVNHTCLNRDHFSNLDVISKLNYKGEMGNCSH